MMLDSRLSTAEDDDNDVRRARIIDHAMHAFMAQGYDGANIEDIAIAAGVSKVTIYRYFGDKAGLVADVIRIAAREMVVACRQQLELSGSIEQVLTAFAIRYITWMMHPIGTRPFYEISRLVMEVSYHHPNIIRAWHDALLAGFADPLQTYIQGQIDQRVLAGDDARFLMVHFFQSLFYASAAIVAPAEGPARAPAADHIADVAVRKVRLFLHGCATA
jgi:AcrR family transcriptional regulator